MADDIQDDVSAQLARTFAARDADRYARIRELAATQRQKVEEAKAVSRAIAEQEPVPRELTTVAKVGDFTKSAFVRGPISAVEEAGQLVHQLADSLPGGAGGWGGVEFRDGRIHFVSADEWAAREFSGESMGLEDLDLPKPDAPKTVAGNVGQGITQFLTGFVVASKQMKALGATGNIVRGATAGAVADFAVFDGHEARLSNLIEGVPALQNPITDYLAASDEDTEIEGRLKNAIEGLGLGGLIDSLMLGVRAIKHARVAKKLQIDELTAKPEVIEVPEPAKPQVELPEQPITKIGEADAALAKVEANANPKFDPEQIKSKLKVDQAKKLEFSEWAAQGNYKAAKGLIDFNKDTIDWTQIEAGDHVAAILNKTSEVFEELIDEAKGGVQSWGQTKRLAALTGTSAERVHKLYADVRGHRGLAARTMAAEKTLLASASKLRELAMAAKEQGFSQQAMANLWKHVNTHAAIQAEVKGAKTEVARALNAMQIIKKAEAAQFREFDDVIRIIGNDKSNQDFVEALLKQRDAVQLNKTVRRAAGNRMWNAMMEVYINGLLSGPKTLVINTVSGMLKLTEGVVERYVAAGIGKARNVMGVGSKHRIRLAEANAYTYGMVAGMRDALNLPLKELANTSMKEWSKVEGLGNVYKAAIEGKQIVDVTQRLEGARKAIYMEPATKNASFTNRGIVKAVNGLGSLVRLPSRAILVNDELFKTMLYRQQLHSLAYRKAFDAADLLKLTGAKRQKFMTQSIADTLKNTPEEIQFESLNWARYETFTSRLGEKGRALESFVAKVPFMRFFMPFIRTPINIFKQGMERTPILNLALQETRDALAKGGPEADLVYARMIMGSAAITGMWVAVQNGTITGGGSVSKRPNTRNMSGRPKYSIKVGDTWLQYHRLDPWGSVMGLSADLFELVDRGLSPGNEDLTEDIEEASVGVMIAISKNALSKTWAKGVFDLVNALSDPERNLAQWATNMGSSLVPFSSALRTAESVGDPAVREAFGIVDRVKASVPGLSEDMPLKRDVLGRPITPTEGLGPDWLSPIAIGHESENRVDRELSALAFDFDMPDKQMDGIPLTEHQYSRLLELRGQEIRVNGLNLEEQLARTIESPHYKKLSDGRGETESGRATMIKNVVSKYGRAAKAQLIQEDSELEARIVNKKTRKKRELIEAQ